VEGGDMGEDGFKGIAPVALFPPNVAFMIGFV
jgi:hypothetical protein